MCSSVCGTLDQGSILLWAPSALLLINSDRDAEIMVAMEWNHMVIDASHRGILNGSKFQALPDMYLYKIFF